MYYRQSMEISNIAPMVSLWSSCCVTVDKDGVETVWYRYFPIDCAKWLKAICVYSLSSGSFTLTLAKWVHFPLVAFSHSTPIQMEWNTPLGKWKKKEKKNHCTRDPRRAVGLNGMNCIFFNKPKVMIASHSHSRKGQFKWDIHLLYNCHSNMKKLYSQTLWIREFYCVACRLSTPSIRCAYTMIPIQTNAYARARRRHKNSSLGTNYYIFFEQTKKCDSCSVKWCSLATVFFIPMCPCVWANGSFYIKMEKNRASGGDAWHLWSTGCQIH